MPSNLFYFVIAFALAGLLGFAIQRGGTCTVAAIDENGVRLQLADRWLSTYSSRSGSWFALPEQVFGMAWKIHHVMEHASNFDAVSLHAKKDARHLVLLRADFAAARWFSIKTSGKNWRGFPL
jgi:hypothetical protein